MKGGEKRLLCGRKLMIFPKSFPTVLGLCSSEKFATHMGADHLILKLGVGEKGRFSVSNAEELPSSNGSYPLCLLSAFWAPQWFGVLQRNRTNRRFAHAEGMCYEELTQTIIETDQSQDLQSLSWGLRV